LSITIDQLEQIKIAIGTIKKIDHCANQCTELLNAEKPNTTQYDFSDSGINLILLSPIHQYSIDLSETFTADDTLLALKIVLELKKKKIQQWLKTNGIDIV